MEKYLNKIIKGNCLELIKELPDNCVDLVYTDPPYFEDVKVRKVKESNSRIQRTISETHNKVAAINSKIHIRDYFGELLRVSKNKQMIIWFDYRRQLKDILDIVLENELKYYFLVWIKKTAVPFANTYNRDMEYAIYIYDKANNYMPEYRKTFIEEHTKATHNTGDNAKFVEWHPTPKPLNIVTQHILKHTKPEDVVLDIFMGSGTTAAACYLEDRKYIGFELDEDYYTKSLDRISKLKSQIRFNF